MVKPDVDRKDVIKFVYNFMCDNLFFVKGIGLKLSNKIMDILRSTQPEKRGQIKIMFLVLIPRAKQLDYKVTSTN